MIRCLLKLVLVHAIDVSFARLRSALSLYVVLKQLYSTFGGTQVLYITLYLKVEGFTQLSFLVTKVLLSVCV